MKKTLLALFSGLLLIGCGSEEQPKEENEHKEEVILEVCDCVEPSAENEAKCAELFPEISDEQKYTCLGDTVISLDSLSQEEKDSVREEYENDLSLEIKEIEEEKEDPISEECKMFLEDYAAEIKSFTALTEQITADPENIGLQIQFSSASDDINSWASKPQMFQCSQNKAFQKQVEILNTKRDKLLEM